ncbi:MAG: TlpA disulfide reductase family protein [Phycisphaerales bacterium]
MNLGRKHVFAALIAAVMAFSSSALADDRTAEEILEDINGLVFPAYDGERAEDKAFMKRFFEVSNAITRLKAAYILELYQSHPDHEKTVELMQQRWAPLIADEQLGEVIAAEMAAVIKDSPDSELAGAARFTTARASVQKNLWGSETANIDQATEAAETFIAAMPQDDRGAQLLSYLARAHEDGSDERIAVNNRITKNYPDSAAAKFLLGKYRQAEGIGEPFELEFTDAITGTTISSEGLKGQVVIVDFWATWCGPCVAEMPHMKELYAKYHDEGVEFIGISLDQPEEDGGLEALKKYVDENEIAWPQYYQGNGWASEFSTSWGINGIPTLFAVDKRGNLHTVQARGKVEELIHELLAD